MHITFVDSEASWRKQLPLTYTRPVADLRVGILKIHEKWKQHLSADEVFFRSRAYLNPLFAVPEERSLCILGSLLPTTAVLEAIKVLKKNEAVVSKGQLVAGFFEPKEAFEIGDKVCIEVEDVVRADHPWDLFRLNGQEIREDFALITRGRTSEAILDPFVQVYEPGQVFVEKGASIKASILNAENGPIYIGKNSTISEGSIIKGPFAINEFSTISMGAKMRGDNTIGPYSKAGGEVANSIIQGYSNKGHDGYLGNSVIGHWCNLGADTNNSNLKNNYANVKMWDYGSGRFADTGLQFCGLIMGDHAKCGINTMFNTGTTVGVSANVFGGGFPRTFIPSFSWGGYEGFSTYRFEKAIETAELVFNRRNKDLTLSDKSVLMTIFEQTAHYRSWDKN